MTEYFINGNKVSVEEYIDGIVLEFNKLKQEKGNLIKLIKSLRKVSISLNNSYTVSVLDIILQEYDSNYLKIKKLESE